MSVPRILMGSTVVRLRGRLLERLHGLPVEVADIAASGDAPADALIVGQGATADVRSSLRAGIRWVQSLGTGVESVLVPEVVGSDVVVTNSAGASAGPVAEFAFARILEHAKRLGKAAEQQRDRLWDPYLNDGLEGAALCVVGLGAIGRRVVSVARAFNMAVVGVRRRPEMGADGCDVMFGPEELPVAIAQSDYVVLAVADTAGTRGLIGREALEATKSGALIVNVGRAAALDHDALVALARDGRVTAALDVLPQEPLPAESPLWDTPRIAVSPHVAVLTPRVLDTIVDLVVENVARFVDGRPLINVVDKRLGYVASPASR